MKMPWIVVALVVVFSVFDIHALELTTDAAQSLVDAVENAPGVTISSGPMPPPVIEVLKLERPVAKLRSAKKWRLAKRSLPPIMLLSRTERRQVALLLVANRSPGDQRSFAYQHGDDIPSGLDELVLHRSFSYPKVVAEPDDADADSQGLSAEVRLRLLMARFKAVEALALSQVPDTDEALSDNVRNRLFEARRMAVQAHLNRFGFHG
jgi:hypothetical protein